MYLTDCTSLGDGPYTYVAGTGSGKTNTVDLILGMLEAQECTLAVDGKTITEHNRRAWQRSNCYVPQQIYLADDNLTEQAVMEAVHNLGHEITIILIAHRLSTVKACDTIFLLENGELKAQGTFDDLTQTNKRFKAMAGAH